MSAGLPRVTSLDRTLRIDVSDVTVQGRSGRDDATWDAFVAASPQAPYRQSSSWGSFRETFGWTVTRICVYEGESLVGGVQLLLRPLRLVGAVGYVQGGPVVREGDTEVLRRCLDELETRCRSARVRYLALTPPTAEPWFLDVLTAHGFLESPQFDSPRATVRIDLEQRHEALLARMGKSTRANVRRGMNRGLSARKGTASDLPVFYELLAGAGARKGFVVRPKRYYFELYAAFAAVQRAHLFIVESGAEPVAAQFSLSSGDTLYTCFMAWSGAHGERKPNHLLEWTAICWAKEQGLRFYDFEGIDHAAAGTAIDGAGTDDWVSPYKLSYGGDVVRLPATYERVPGALLRWGHSTVLPRIERVPAAARAKRRLVRKMSGR